MRQLYKTCLSRTVLGNHQIEETDCRFEGVEGECEGELFGAFNLFQFEDSSILQRLMAEYAELEAAPDCGRELKGLKTMPNDLAKQLVSRDSSARSSEAASDPPRSKDKLKEAVEALAQDKLKEAVEALAPVVQGKRKRVGGDTPARPLQLGKAQPARLKLEAPNYSTDR